MGRRKPIIGIDLGTTRSVAAYAGLDGHVTYLPDRDGDVLTPSCVFVQKDGTTLAGRQAAQAAARCPDRAAEAFKRHLGEEDWSWPVDGETYSAPKLSAILLRRLVEDAQRVIGEIEGVVITVPAYFGDRERSAMLDAAVLADVEVVRLFNEPTSAAIAAAFEAYVAAGGDGRDLTTAAIASTAPGISVLCDLGGGTFDVTAIRVDGNKFDVLATGGQRLGGRDFDDFIIETMYRHIFDSNGPDPHHDPTALAQMRQAAEQAKHTLTVRETAEIPAPYAKVPPLTLTRAQFEKDCAGLIDRTRDVIAGVMIDAGLTWAHVDSLLLVGGASRMPMFRRAVQSVSNLTPQAGIQPDLIVAHGAAVFGAIMQIQERRPSRRPANAASGGSDRLVAVADSEGLDESVPAFEPGFAAAAGAVQVREVTSRSLGVLVHSPAEGREVNATIIARNTPLPAIKTRVFATHEPNQRRVVVPIIEGEPRDPLLCAEVGECMIDHLPPDLPQGSPVRVTFSYDPSGRVTVQAEELSTGSGARTTLTRDPTGPAEPIAALAAAVAEVRRR